MRHMLGEFRDHDDHLELVGEDRGEEYDRPDRRVPMIVLAVAAMAVFAGGLWFAYYQGTRHPVAISPSDSVPLLRADERPAKVRPDQPGGMTIPDQNVSLYNDKPGAPPVEKLLPAAEQPLPRPVAPTREVAAAAPPSSAPPALVTALQPTAAPPAVQPARPAAKTAPAKPPQPAPSAAAPVKAPAGTGPIQLRLASLRSSEAARDEWTRLKHENPDLLGKLTAVAVRTDLGDKGIYYRIQAGSFSDAATAEKLCNELRRRNLGCILAR